jgi:hypothetical protein
VAIRKKRNVPNFGADCRRSLKKTLPSQRYT